MGLKNINFKQILLEKGERIGFVAGLSVMGLLFLCYLGGSAFSEGPQKKVELLQSLNAKAKTAFDQSAPPDNSDKLPEELNVTELKLLDPAIYACNLPYFQLLEREDRKWRQPKVLAPNEFQVDLVRGAVQSYYLFQDPKKGRVLGVLKTKSIAELTPEAKRAMDEYLRRLPGMSDKVTKRLKPRRPLQIAGQPPIPGQPLRPGMIPGQPGISPPGAGPRGEGGLPGGAGPGMLTLNQGAPTNVDQEVKMVPEKDLPHELTGAKLAETYIPIRMVEISAAFPYRAQLENFRQALRLNSLDDLFASQDIPLPTFAGFNVQRRAYTLDNKLVNEDWEDLDYEPRLRYYMTRMKEAEPEDPVLEAVGVIIRPNKLVIPRPKLAREQHYPDVKLAAIDQTREAMEKAMKSGEAAPPKPDSRFDINDIFNDKPTAESAIPGGGEGGRMGPREGAVTTIIPGAPVRTPAGMRPPGGEGASGAARQPGVYPEHCLVRFLDANVQPGYQYEYRIQIKMLNPTYKRDDRAVSKKIAREKEIEGPWTEVKWKEDDKEVSRLTVGDELQYYVMQEEKGANAESGSARTIHANQDQAVVQIHRWLPTVKTKPGEQANDLDVGDWSILEKHAVRRGEYVGKWAEVEVPVWLTTQDRAGFAIHPDEQLSRRLKTGGTQRYSKQHKGVPVDFGSDPIKSGKALVVDFDGGERTIPASGGKPLKFNGPVDVLILNADGKLVVRNSHDDTGDRERKERYDAWSKWIATVRNMADNPNPGGGEGLFSKPGTTKPPPKKPGGGG